MAKDLSLNELKELRTLILDLIDESQQRRADLKTSGAINEGQSVRISGWENLLQKQVVRINNQLLGMITTELDEPGEKIKKATENVKDAIKTLDDFNKFIAIVASVGSMLVTLIKAFTTGNLFGLVDILDEINNLAP